MRGAHVIVGNPDDPRMLTALPSRKLKTKRLIDSLNCPIGTLEKGNVVDGD